MPDALQPLAPEDAIRFLRSKGLAPPDNRFDYRDFWREQHANGFVVAKMLSDDLLLDTQDLVIKKLQEGLSRQQIAAELETVFRAYGWWGQQELKDPLTGEIRPVRLGSQHRIRIIVDTNLRTAHAAGHWDRIQRQKQVFPYLRYVAVMDERTRDQHRAWHGIILPVDHPFWRTHFPPNGWLCRCRVQQLTAAQAERLGGVTPDPEIEVREWLNKRTGEIERVPIGIDPGFGYNVGLARRPGGLPPPTPPTAPSPPIVSGSGAAEIAEAFADAPASVRRALDNMTPLTRFEIGPGQGGWYRPSEHRIFVSERLAATDGRNAIIRHEMGHALDVDGAKRGGKHWSTQLSEEAIEAAQADGDELARLKRRRKHTVLNELNARMEEITGEIAQANDDWKKVIDARFERYAVTSDDLLELIGETDVTPQGLQKVVGLIAALDTRNAETLLRIIPQTVGTNAGFSDFLGAITANRVVGAWKHTNEYYRQRGASGYNLGRGNTSEAFANYMDAEGSKNRAIIAMMEELAPRTIAMFRAIVDQLGNPGGDKS